MILYLINPNNPLVSLARSDENRWNKYTVWKPLGLLVLASLTPKDWEIKVFDENVCIPDYSKLPKPDLVGITAFTSQADRAYSLSEMFRKRNIPVIMGGIHASMCPDETRQHVTSVVIGEAESVWSQLLIDFQSGNIQPIYHGIRQDMDAIPAARHDLLQKGYHFGSIQISRGCPLACSFCSVTTFNGGLFRRRPIDNVIEEFKLIKEKYVLVVDDNLIGIRSDQIAHTKLMLKAMIAANLKKRWIAQVTINMADDEELLSLAAKAGCFGVFIGFESITKEGLIEIQKKFNLKNERNCRESVKRIQRHGIIVVGSFIMGLDVDKKDIGTDIATVAKRYHVDAINVMFLTPLPGTKLWEKMLSEKRIAADNFPNDWKYFTLTFPVANYMHLSWEDMLREKETCYRKFYSYPRIFRRINSSFWNFRKPFTTLATNLVYRLNALHFDKKSYKKFDKSRGTAHVNKIV